MNQFKFTVGDWSDDGHGQYETFIFKTENSIEEIRKAVSKLACDEPEYENQAEEYEDSSVSPHLVEKWEGFGIKFHGENSFDGADHYAEVWAKLIEHYNPHIKLTRLKNEVLPTIHGGGYGLFYG